MSAALLDVPGEAYEAASTVVGDGAGLTLQPAVVDALDALSALGGMAGSDEAGRSWAEGYDRSAAAALQTAADAVNACFRLAALLQQTGFNYGQAELASAPVGAVPTAPDTTVYSERSFAVDPPPSAAGSSGVAGEPAGWSLVRAAVGFLWPNGHQDRLRAAAAAWRSLADGAETAADQLPRAYACLGATRSPECDDAELSCRSVREQLGAVAVGARALASSCEEYAHHLDEAHSAVEDELVSLLAWSAGIEGLGLLGAVVTLGGSEAAAQAAEASRIAAAAVRIAAILNKLGALARAAAIEVANAGSRLVDASAALRPLLTARIVVAVSERVESLKVAQIAAVEAENRLVVASGLDLSSVPVGMKREVVEAVERARTGTVRFTGHDGKVFEDWHHRLPAGGHFREWTVGGPNSGRKELGRLIIEGPPSSPRAIYYWDHNSSYVRIGP